MMTRVEDQVPPIFLEFAGQGVKYIDELRSLYAAYPAIRTFIQEAITEIKEQASQYDDSRSGFFSQGLDVDHWIECPEKTPDPGYLLSSPLSHPLIYLCQIANYISIIQEDVEQGELLRNAHSATGFSTGVVAAILISMGLPLDELCKLAIRVQAMFFWQGVRCQQAMLNHGASPKLVPELIDSVEGSPSCMANITGLTRRRLEDLIEAFSGSGTIYPAYELLPGRWIVAGLPKALMEFSKFLKERAKKATWKYIPSSIAAHCPYLSYALETCPSDAARVGVAFRGEQMKIPVWSNDSGSDLRASEDILLDVMRAYFTRPGIWRLQTAPLFQPTDVAYVLDFGPGTGVASLTESYTSNSGIQVIRCAVPLGRRRLIEKVLPIMARV
jgi:malonyl CoA-acyl carrier protein transacylase